MISTTQDRIQTKTADRWGEFFANYNIMLSQDNKFIIPHDHPQFDEIMYQIDRHLDYDVDNEREAMIVDMNVREHFPFSQKKLSSNTFIREFNKDVNPKELIWHMDRENRYVTVKSGNGWQLQMDNQVPAPLVEGETYFIPKYTYHRIIKGDENLSLLVKEDNMSLKKEELVWLMEQYADSKPNCGCGKDPCETYGNLEATPVLDVDMSAMTITGEPDHEIKMAHKQLHRAAEYAEDLAKALHEMPETNLPAWVQAKITTATDYITKVYNYLGEYLPQMAYGQGMADAEEMSDQLLQGEMAPMKEEMEGEIAKARHEVEIELNISKSDMKKLHDGEKVTLKDTTGSNKFTVTVSAS